MYLENLRYQQNLSTTTTLNWSLYHVELRILTTITCNSNVHVKVFPRHLSSIVSIHQLNSSWQNNVPAVMTPPTRRQLSSISVLIARQSFLALCPNDLITDLSWRPVWTGVIYTRQLITKLGIDCNFLPHVLGQGHQLYQPREMSLSGRPHVTILPSSARKK